jgi:hypothetical protein
MQTTQANDEIQVEPEVMATHNVQAKVDVQSAAAMQNQTPFSAYGLSKQGDDPWLQIVHHLIDHAKEQQQRIEALELRLGLNQDAIASGSSGAQALDRLSRWVDDQVQKS